MFNKKVISVNKKPSVRYRFNINDTVLCTIKDSNIKNAVILSRYLVNNIPYYKIGNNLDTKVCKENELINR